MDVEVKNGKTGTEQVERTRTYPFRRTNANATPYRPDVRPKFENLWTQTQSVFSTVCTRRCLEMALCAHSYSNYSPLYTAVHKT